MPPPTGFTWSVRSNGELAIGRDGRVVTVLRGRAAARVESRLLTADDAEAQQVLARASGNYRRGNERA